MEELPENEARRAIPNTNTEANPISLGQLGQLGQLVNSATMPLTAASAAPS